MQIVQGTKYSILIVESSPDYGKLLKTMKWNTGLLYKYSMFIGLSDRFMVFVTSFKKNSDFRQNELNTQKGAQCIVAIMISHSRCDD